MQKRIIFFLLLLVIIIIINLKKIVKFFKKKNIELSGDELDYLSASNNSVRVNKKLINEILKKDNASIFSSLQNKKLEKLFAIRANIENYISSPNSLEKDLYKMFGMLLVYVGGVYTTAILGTYSGIISNLVSELLKIDDKNSENKSMLNNISEILNNYFTLEKITAPLVYSGIVIFFLASIIVIKGHYTNKFDNRIYVLLDIVNYAIEVGKAEGMVKSKESEDTKSKDPSKNEPIEEKKTALENLGSKLLDTESTNKLLNELDYIMEYNTIKNEISNFKSPQLYSIKANLKNALDNGKYAYSIIFQYIAVFASFVTGLIVKDQPFWLIVIALLIISGLFLLITKEIVTDKNDVKKRFLLEIVEEEIESKKNSNK